MNPDRFYFYIFYRYKKNKNLHHTTQNNKKVAMYRQYEYNSGTNGAECFCPLFFI